MTYNPGYDNYDPYMSRSLSRRSVGYPGTPYPHQVYPDGIPLSHPGSEVSFYNNYIPFFSNFNQQYQQPYQIYAPSGNAAVPMSRRLTSGKRQHQDLTRSFLN